MSCGYEKDIVAFIYCRNNNVKRWPTYPDVDIHTLPCCVPEFFCWDCYSDSPLCGTRVDTQKAHYLGKTPCPSTNKCFVRKQGDGKSFLASFLFISSVTNVTHLGLWWPRVAGAIPYCADLHPSDNPRFESQSDFQLSVSHPWRRVSLTRQMSTTYVTWAFLPQ